MSKDKELTAKEIKTIVFESIGHASMCWHETPSGVFDSEEATKVGDNLLSKVNDYVSLQVKSHLEKLTENIIDKIKNRSQNVTGDLYLTTTEYDIDQASKEYIDNLNEKK